MKIERGYAQHVGSRNEQQDAGLVMTDDGRAEQLILVADGMGGHAGGSLASAQVAETARRLWAEHQKTPLEPKRLLERIIREGHEAINRAGAEKGLTPRSTCVLLFLHNGSAHWAHVGDSRIYRLRDGQVTRLTRDHSVVQMLVDLGKVSEQEMGTHPDQNRLTQSLGGEANPMPDFGSDGVKEHDAFLVCSDGLWEMIEPPEMAAELSAKKLGDDGAKRLVEHAFARAKPRSDNITVALLRVGGPPPGSIGADLEDARTTRILGQPPLKRASGGGARWGFAAATVVALGAAAAVVYKPWDKRGLDSGTTPAVGPKEKPSDQSKPPAERTEPPKTDPARPGAEPKPAERREAVPPPSPPPTQRTPEAPPPTDKQPAPESTPPPASPGQPSAPGQPATPAPGDRGATKPPEPPATGGEPSKKQAAPKPAPARPAQPATPRQSGLGPDEKKSAEPPPNSEKPPAEPPATRPQGPGQPPETKPQ